MRLKFVLGNGHRSVEVVEYDFSTDGPVPTVTYTRSDGAVKTEEIVCDVYVTSQHGTTIDRLIPSKQTSSKRT